VSPPKKIRKLSEKLPPPPEADGKFSSLNVIERPLAVNADFALFFTGFKEAK
jgi:hypothetical protein